MLKYLKSKNNKIIEVLIYIIKLLLKISKHIIKMLYVFIFF